MIKVQSEALLTTSPRLPFRVTVPVTLEFDPANPDIHAINQQVVEQVNKAASDPAVEFSQFAQAGVEWIGYCVHEVVGETEVHVHGGPDEEPYTPEDGAGGLGALLAAILGGNLPAGVTVLGSFPVGDGGDAPFNFGDGDPFAGWDEEDDNVQ